MGRLRTSPFETAPPTAAGPDASSVWDRAAAAHLVRRTGFGARKRDVDAAIADGTPARAADRLLREALAVPLPEPPGWVSGGSGPSEIERVYEVQRGWFEAMRVGGLGEKMTLFLHNLLATQHPKHGRGALAWHHLDLLRRFSLGNFRTLVGRIGQDPAMLIYLDGALNRKGAANENYARELLELFTMGQTGPDGAPNYTETDVKEIARALTGWSVNAQGRATFDLAQHDRGSKTFFGRTGAWGYDDVVRIVFEARPRAIAYFVCRKLYCFFVEARPHAETVDMLAGVFVANNFEIAPVVRALLVSERFFAPGVVGAKLKSPVELLVGLLREAEIAPTAALYEAMRVELEPTGLGMELLNPPNVAGWPGLNPPGSDGLPGHYTWLTTSTLPERWRLAERLLTGAMGAAHDPLDLARKASDPADPYTLPADLARVFLPVPLGEAGIRNVAEPFGGNTMRPPPDAFLAGPAHAVNLSKLLLDGTPHYEWAAQATGTNAAGLAAARRLLTGYLVYLTQLPEYQLT